MKELLIPAVVITLSFIGGVMIGEYKAQVRYAQKEAAAFKRGQEVILKEHNLLQRREEIVRMEALGAPTCKLDRALLITIIRMCERQKCV